MRLLLPVLLPVLGLCSVFLPPAQAGQPLAPAEPLPPAPSPFDRGRLELQVGAGPYFSLANNDHGRRALNDADLSLRLGCMLNTPSGSGLLRGNSELLGELFAGGIFHGPGDVLAGLTLLLRYNFVQPEARWVPYFQLGVGGVYNNVYRDEDQRLFGCAFEFNLQTSLGLRWMAAPNRACFLEVGYRHISNASLADRNIGLNSLGVLVGASWFF